MDSVDIGKKRHTHTAQLSFCLATEDDKKKPITLLEKKSYEQKKRNKMVTKKYHFIVQL